ncbi:hypothetical protein NDU88_002323 [Pleurodeles waltl]|uniref:Uncharacterized protein n=1 Tax=Pleurodeles waltl TaxID=8319 RepID=A0AAV7VE92_PLEWA|nr:hypothetical protein NDU88_002323 [Pleurodeles waltl]
MVQPVTKSGVESTRLGAEGSPPLVLHPRALSPARAVTVVAEDLRYRSLSPPSSPSPRLTSDFSPRRLPVSGCMEPRAPPPAPLLRCQRHPYGQVSLSGLFQLQQTTDSISPILAAILVSGPCSAARGSDFISRAPPGPIVSASEPGLLRTFRPPPSWYGGALQFTMGRGKRSYAGASRRGFFCHRR